MALDDEIQDLENAINETSQTASAASNEFERWSQNISKAKSVLSSLGDKLADIGGARPEHIIGASAEKEVSSAQRALEQLLGNTEKLRDIKIDGRSIFGGITETLGGLDFTDLKASAEISMRAMASDMMKALEDISKQAEDTNGVLTSLGTLGIAKLKSSAIQGIGKIAGLNELQEELRTIQKQALQTGITFGESFADANKGSSAFLTSLNKTSAELYASMEQIMSIRGRLARAFSAGEVSSAITGLGGAIDGVNSSINLTNVALNVARATGMDEAKVADMMAEAHLQLGASIEDSALAFGTLRQAARDSGLTFDTVADSIFNSAKTLKFFGGSIDSVAPLFRRFNESLRGIGREGLTPELFDTFIRQLNTMSTSTRALLAMQSPTLGGPGVGILGGALKVEQALETGEGLGEVARSITETMKRFAGGGPILTRAEAMESPAAQRTYVIQRQILGTLTKIGDPGQQNMMMKILQDMERGGSIASEDAKKNFAELMSAGEEVGKATTTEMVKAQREFTALYRDNSTSILGILKDIAENTGIAGMKRTMTDITQMAIGGGAPRAKALQGAIGTADERDLAGTIQSTRSSAEKMLESAKNLELSSKEQMAVGKEAGLKRAVATIMELDAAYKRMREQVLISSEDAMKQFKLTGALNKEQHKEIWKRAQMETVAREREIQERLKMSGLSTTQRSALKEEQKQIKDARMELEKRYRMGERGSQYSGSAQDILKMRQTTMQQREEYLRTLAGPRETFAEGVQMERQAIATEAKVKVEQEPIKISAVAEIRVSVDENGRIIVPEKMREIAFEVSEETIRRAFTENSLA